MNLLNKLEKKYEILFLILASLVFFLLRLPSLFEPYWYGDEGIYEVIGFALRHGRLLYRDIWDNKPPLLYTLYGLFNGDQSTIRFVSLASGIFAIILFFYLAKRLFPKGKTRLLSTIFFSIIFGLPVIEGNIANAENFILPIILGAALLILHANKMHSHTKNQNTSSLYFILFLAGLLVGIAFLFKIVAIFDLAAFAFFLFTTRYTRLRDILRHILSLLPLFAGFILPFVLTLFFFLNQHALYDYIKSAFLMNVSYVNAGNKFIIPQGLLVGKMIILALVCLFIFLRRKNFSAVTLFISIWFVFSIFNALFSQRPYVHYLLVLLSSFSLFIGMVLFEKRIKWITAWITTFILIFLFKDFWYYGNNIGYYRNFIDFVTGKETINTYRAFFNQATLRDYDLAEYINSHAKPTDTIFIWGDNGQLYKLTNTLPPGRFIVEYHMVISPQTLQETKFAIQRAKPKFVIIMPQKPILPYSLTSYRTDIEVHGAVIYERVN